MIEDEYFRQRVVRIVDTLPCNDESKKDILQELFIYLSALRRNKPQQNASWYLQACKFHAQHLLAAGRSIDSPKRAAKQVPLPDDPDLADELLNPHADRNGLFFSAVSADDIERLLAKRLSRKEAKILLLLKDGYSLRQIAAMLRVSHPTVRQYRMKIERFARQLGLHPASEAERLLCAVMVFSLVCADWFSSFLG